MTESTAGKSHLKTKKIAIIIERANIALGGAERSVLELAAALSGLGLEVDILAAKGRTDASNLRILCQNTPGRRVRFFTFEKALKKVRKEFPCKVSLFIDGKKVKTGEEIHSTNPNDLNEVVGISASAGEKEAGA